MNRVIALVLLCLLAASCSRPAAARKRPVVETTLPVQGFTIGRSNAAAVVVEFGTYRCGYCRTFHDELLPRLVKEARSGRISFRYVEVSPSPSVEAIGLVAECLAARLGMLDAQRWAFNAVFEGNDSALVSKAALLAGTTEAELSQCGEQRRRRQGLERDAADSLGVRITPTFLVGYAEPSGRIVAWPISGYYPDSLAAFIRDAERAVAPSGWGRLRRVLHI